MKKRIFTALIVFVFMLIIISIRKQSDNNIYSGCKKNEGTVFGTFYHIAYEADNDYHNDIKELLKQFDNSLSTFNKKSVISRINLNDDTVVPDLWFNYVFNLSKDINIKTDGAFDITVAPLVNLWGFGYEKASSVTESAIDSIKDFVGSDKVWIDNEKVTKADFRVKLDASAIAKGYASDVVAQFLKDKNIENYMVEIGGEVALSGVNSKGKCWQIGINKPLEDAGASQGEIQEILSMCEGALATSGNYRNFYYKDGKRYAHTIDPRSGYPIEHSLLSASVIAPECIMADAYATSLMVCCLASSLEIVENTPEIEAYFISSGSDQSYNITMSSGFDKYLLK